MKKRRWVIKAGSAMVCEGGPRLIRSWMKQVRALAVQFNIEVIWVSSGAIAEAALQMKFKKKTKSLPEKQALSAIGQPLIMESYNRALSKLSLRGAQVLLTADDISDKTRSKNLRNTLNQILKMKLVPILNENDAVATDEIQFGDNDSLASKVAIMMKAEKLILLTDVEGLYTADPKTDSRAKIIKTLRTVRAKTLNLASQGSKSKLGKGGMLSKLLASQNASRHHIVTHLMKGDTKNGLLRIAKNENPGTCIGRKK